MASSDEIETALEAWRVAERRKARTFVGDTTRLNREVERRREEYQRLSTEHMVEWMAGFDAAKRDGSRRTGPPRSAETAQGCDQSARPRPARAVGDVGGEPPDSCPVEED